MKITVEKNKVKEYRAKVKTWLHPNGIVMNFLSDEGVKGVRKHIKGKKWTLLSKISLAK